MERRGLRAISHLEMLWPSKRSWKPLLYSALFWGVHPTEITSTCWSLCVCVCFLDMDSLSCFSETGLGVWMSQHETGGRVLSPLTSDIPYHNHPDCNLLQMQPHSHSLLQQVPDFLVICTNTNTCNHIGPAESPQRGRGSVQPRTERGVAASGPTANGHCEHRGDQAPPAAQKPQLFESIITDSKLAATGIF